MKKSSAEYVDAFRKRRRMKVIDYLGGCCVVCGDATNLECDHIDPSTKSFTISNNLQISWSRLVAELDKCQLLCRDHHIEKTIREQSGREPVNKGRWVHGTTTSYMAKGCRCNLCRTFYSEYKRERRKNRGWL